MALERLQEFFKKPDFGLLILRTGLGAMMVAHGVDNIMNGKMEWLGSQLAIFGITFGYTFWGFLAALTHTIGGFLVVIGYLFRSTCFLIFLTMLVAIGHHLDAGDGILIQTGHAIKTAIVFLALTLIGPGRFSMQRE